jgi:hypothetical protein
MSARVLINAPTGHVSPGSNLSGLPIDYDLAWQIVFDLFGTITTNENG